MSKKIMVGVVVLLIAAYSSVSFKSASAQVSFKCLVQLTNYSGEGAYVMVSLIDNKGKYKKTLQVFGKEKRWWDDLPSWFKFYTITKENVDGVSGASITAGSRRVFSITADETVFDKGYQLRFETAVENKDYKEKDVEMAFSEANVGKAVEGTGYIRYVKLIKNP
ncbi:DUF2271 domain-containing protein [Runella slithyformis]|uniref:DUF2271 domain-containing protein n=1 Tax=Runella slithyformis (strain ATCC 29530 / DSM 19594 / LMG 11500 / NCIMB 11436 / LSU 4) TaxID=761193 RepID=A0A7U4E7T1_RUNSL|nr:DUF2271 domain-containing protein [Runella slithyformis]AEI50981.1 hypothetical protein Runsl_4662 [Runella slithyformis DSM 19594]